MKLSRQVYVRAPVLRSLHPWLIANGLLYQDRPSATAFFRALLDGRYARSAAPLPDTANLEIGNLSSMTVPEAAYKMVNRSLHQNGYRSWNHLCADIAAGNWRKVA